MTTVSAEVDVTIRAPAQRCFEAFADVTSYPRWEPSARAVSILETYEPGRDFRVEFCYARRILFLTYSMTYSLRCTLFEHEGRYWIKFSEPMGDLFDIMTIIEFSDDPSEDTCLMTYRSNVNEPAVVRRTLLSFFGPREIKAHLFRFKHFVEAECSVVQHDLKVG